MLARLSDPLIPFRGLLVGGIPFARKVFQIPFGWNGRETVGRPRPSRAFLNVGDD